MLCGCEGLGRRISGLVGLSRFKYGSGVSDGWCSLCLLGAEWLASLPVC